MKKYIWMGAALLALSVGACKDDEPTLPPPPMAGEVELAADLAGDSIDATGTVAGVLDTTELSLNLVLEFADFDSADAPTAWMIHSAGDSAGAMGDVLVDLGVPSSPLDTTITLTEAQQGEIIGGKTSIIVHTDEHPEGAIWGPLEVK